MNAQPTLVPTRMSLPLWHERHAAPLAPINASEMRARGWDTVDVVFVTGDAYVDHPSFAMAILTRVVEAAGFPVPVRNPPRRPPLEALGPIRRARPFAARRGGHTGSTIPH